MYGLIEHFTSVLWTWAIKFPRLIEAFFLQRYVHDIIHWSKSLIAWTLFWRVFFDGYDTMDTILDMKTFFCLLFVFVYYQLMLNGKMFFFCSCWVILLAYCFGKMALVTTIMDSIYLWLSAMDNALLHAYVNYPEDKIEERITFALGQQVCRCKHIRYIMRWWRI